MKLIDTIALLLTIVGAFNWLLITLCGLNLVHWIFRVASVENVVYVIVGIAAIYSLKFFKHICCCSKNS